MVSSKCRSCSWYKELDFCGGLTEFHIHDCPIEGKLSRRIVPAFSQEHDQYFPLSELSSVSEKYKIYMRNSK